MKVLIACEESQQICKAFRKLGHEAYSCDILPCNGGHPEWHIQDYVENHLHKKWDMLIAHPPCTYIAVSGARWFKDRLQEQKHAIEFFMMFIRQEHIPFIAVESPISIMSNVYRKPDQIIQPWMFGHGETKATCLWLKGLPKLKPTRIVKGREARIHKLPPSKNRSKIRSKTYTGIAKAMAKQWGEVEQ